MIDFLDSINEEVLMVVTFSMLGFLMLIFAIPFMIIFMSRLIKYHWLLKVI